MASMTSYVFWFFFTISEYIITFCSETTLTNLGIYFVRMLLIKEMLAICLVDSWSHHLSWGITFSFAKKKTVEGVATFWLGTEITLGRAITP